MTTKHFESDYSQGILWGRAKAPCGQEMRHDNQRGTSMHLELRQHILDRFTFEHLTTALPHWGLDAPLAPSTKRIG